MQYLFHSNGNITLDRVLFGTAIIRVCMKITNIQSIKINNMFLKSEIIRDGFVKYNSLFMPQNTTATKLMKIFLLVSSMK